MKTSTAVMLAVTAAVAAGGGYLAYKQIKKSKKRPSGILSSMSQMVKGAIASGAAKPTTPTVQAGLGSLGGSVF